MAKLGTAYVEIKPDFSSFDRLVSRRLQSQLRAAGESGGDGFHAGFEKGANRSSTLPLFSRSLDAMADVAKSAGKKAAKGVQDELDKVAVPVPPLELSQTQRIDLQIDGAEQEITKLKLLLGQLTAKPQTIEVQAEIQKALTAYDRVEKRQRKLIAEREQLNVGAAQKVQEAFDSIELPKPAAADFTLGERLDLQIEGTEQDIHRLQLLLGELTAKPQTVEVQAEVQDALRALDRVEARQRKLIANRAQLDAPVAVAEPTASPTPGPLGPELTQIQRIDLQIEGADNEIERLTARIRELTAQPQTVEVKAETLEAIADLDRVEARKRRLGATRTELAIDVDRGLPDLFDRVAGGAQRLLQSLGGDGGGLGGVTTRVSAGFLSFGASLGPVAVLAAAVAVTVGVALVGALGALVASATAAVGGVAALASGLVGILIPGAILAIAVITRLAKIFEALKAQDAVADQASAAAAAGAAAAAAAADQQASAARALGAAQQQMARATISAYKEMEDAAEAASDAVRGIADAQLSLDDSRLSIKEAELALREFEEQAGGTNGALIQKFSDVAVNFDASAINRAVTEAGGSEADALKLERLILRVRQARQQEKNAVDGVSDATRTNSRAQATNNEFLTKGIGASAGYQAAVRGLEEANLGVARAARASEAATKGLSAAQEKADLLTGRLTRSERALLDTLKRVRTQLRGAFSPATDAVIRGIDRALSRLPGTILPLRGAFTTLGQSVGRTLEMFSREFIDPAWTDSIREFLRAGSRIQTTFTANILIPFLRILRDVGREALPFLERGLERVGIAMHRLSAEAGPTKLRSVIGELVSHFKSWLNLVHQVSRVFLAFVTAGAGEGQKLTDSIANWTKRMADFLSSATGQNAIRQFFADVIPAAKEFLRFLGLLGAGMVKLGQQAAPVFTALLRVINEILGIVGKVLFPAAAAQAASTAANTQASAADRLRNATAALTDSQLSAAQAQRDLTNARLDAQRQLNDLASTANNADLSKRGAKFALADARKELASLKARGAGTDALARGQLRVDEALQRVRDTTREAARAHQDNAKAQRKGVEGTVGVRAAKARTREVAKQRAVEKKKVFQANKALLTSGGGAGKAGATEGNQIATNIAVGIETALTRIDGAKLLSGLLRVLGEAIAALFSPKFWIDNFANILSVVTIAIPIAKILKIPGAGFLFRFISKPFFGAVKAVGKGLISLFGSMGGRAVAGILAELVHLAPRGAGAVTRFLLRATSILGRLPAQAVRLAGRVVTGIVGRLNDLAGLAGHAIGRFITTGVKALRGGIDRMRSAAGAIGAAIVGGITAAVDGLAGLIRRALNGVIGIANGVIGGINKVSPLKDIPPIPKLKNPVKKQAGGIVPGVGFGDKIPALLEPAEFVVRRRIVALFGPSVFTDINTGRLDPTLGYPEGARAVPRATPTHRGQRYATGGLAAATGRTEAPRITATFPITVPGGGPPDPTALAVLTARVIEDRFGGDPRQD